MSIIVKAEGPSGPAKIRSDDPKHALGLAQYLRTIGYNVWIEATNGNAIDEKALKMGPLTSSALWLKTGWRIRRLSGERKAFMAVGKAA